MAEFNPDAYLASIQPKSAPKEGFDPDAYLRSIQTKTEEPEKVKMDDFPRFKEESGHRFYPTSGASTGILSGLAGLQGVLKPIAGALEWANIRSPMEALEKNAQYAKSSVPTTLGVNPASAAETVGEIAPSLAIPETLGAKIPQLASAIAKYPSLKFLAPSAVQGLGGQVTDTANKSYMDILGEKIADLGESTALGVAGGKVGQMLTNPQVSARLQQLKDMGMTKFTPGQLASQFPMIGEGLQNFEKKLTSPTQSAQNRTNPPNQVNYIYGEDFKNSFEMAQMSYQFDKLKQDKANIFKSISDLLIWYLPDRISDTCIKEIFQIKYGIYPKSVK